MSVNRHPTKPGHWQIRFYPHGRKGKQIVKVVCGTKEEALRLESVFRSSKREKPSQYPQVSEALPYYLQFYRLDHIDDKVSLYLERWRPYIGNLLFTSIGPGIVEQYKADRLKQGISPSTINKELSALSGLMKWAAEKGYCREMKVKRFPAKMTKAPLPDVPTREEVLALIDGMIWPRCGLFACLYYGGLRASEATMMKAEDVSLYRGTMTVLGKGRKQRVVPIVNQLRPYLEKRLGEVEEGYLWTTKAGKPITDLKTIIRNAKERVGLKRRIYPHLLRHAFGTHATASGVGLRALQHIMGHTRSTTTEIYTTLSNDLLSTELRGKFGK